MNWLLLILISTYNNNIYRRPVENDAIDFFKFVTHDMDKNSFQPPRPRKGDSRDSNTGFTIGGRKGESRTSRRKNSSRMLK